MEDNKTLGGPMRKGAAKNKQNEVSVHNSLVTSAVWITNTTGYRSCELSCARCVENEKFKAR